MATKTTKLTREEKAEQARSAREAERVAEFKQRIARERRKIIYSDMAAFKDDEAHVLDRDNPLPKPRTGAALYEMVSTFRWHKESLRREAQRGIERLTDMLGKLEQGDTRPFGSTVLHSVPADIEAEAASLRTQADAIARFAWATGWYVEEIMPKWELAKRELLLGLRVEHDPVNKITEHDVRTGETRVYESWRVFLGDRELTTGLLHELTGYGEKDGTVPMAYRSEQSAWVVAAKLVGERIEG